MLTDYQGQMLPPDKWTDPIGHHYWFEANKCPDCFGTGKYRPISDHPREYYKAKFGCATCKGSGVAPHLFDPEF